MRKLSIFLVEDSAVIREHLIATLEELSPVRVLGSASDELSALQWLATPGHAVELVLIDLFLAGGSGLGVLRAMGRRAGLPAAAAAPVLVVLSNFISPDMRRHCLGLGALRVFDKSSEVEGLLSYCRQLAEGGLSVSSPA